MPRPCSRSSVGVLSALVLTVASGCADAMRPEMDTPPPAASRWALTPSASWTTPLLSSQQEDECLAVASCSADLEWSEVRCRCELEGLTVTGTRPPPEPPPPPPSWPDPPGWTWPDPETIGGWGWPPPGSGSECDPNAIEGSCTWKAKLDCPLGVARGSYATCLFSIDPPSALLYISGWTFQGENVQRSVSLSEASWGGQVVESGEVKVDFMTVGAEVGSQIVARIGVVPRTGSEWAWTWGSGISYADGGLSNPPAWPENRVAILCHPDRGCASGEVPKDKWYVQPQDPSHGNGFVRAQVQDGGPNHGAWYVQSNSVSVSMASAYNPFYFAGGPATSQGCNGQGPLSFWDFNHSTCGTGSPAWGSGWSSFAHQHEQIHADQAAAVVAETWWPHLDAARWVEGFVRSSSSAIDDRIRAVVDRSGACVTAAVSFHGYPDQPPYGHPVPGFDVWFWLSGQFSRWRPGDPRAGTPLGWAPYPIPEGLLCGQPVS